MEVGQQVGNVLYGGRSVVVAELLGDVVEADGGRRVAVSGASSSDRMAASS